MNWLHIVLVSVSAGALALIILQILRGCFRRDSGADRSLQINGGIARLHQVSPRQADAFRWADHPSLITDAVESGWPRFAFTDLVSLCGDRDRGYEPKLEIGWEVCEGSADFMQKIRLNPNSKKVSTAASVIRAALPLPGPNLGDSSFPQEAYFEVTLLSCNIENGGDRANLIGDDFNKNMEEMRLGRLRHERKSEGLVCVGLSKGGPVAFKLPGTYPGSVAFRSTASLSLDGTKLVHESEKDEWGRPGRVIGCGYNPSQKKVFFTVDSRMVHEIHCKTEVFSSPLYPTLAANTDVTVLVNLGQSPFKFGRANLQRTPNPCFTGLPGTSPTLGYEDSKELFSMGRIDSQWLQRSATRSNTTTVNSIKDIQYDQESDGELFEIVLESIGRSPAYTTTHQ